MLPAPSSAGPGREQIRIELPSGVRLTVDASVDAEALSRVIGGVEHLVAILTQRAQEPAGIGTGAVAMRGLEAGLTATKIHTDDTPVPMLDPGRGKTATDSIWAYVVDDRSAGATTPPLVWYQFTQDRTGSYPQQQLASVTGFPQADGYSGYDKL